MKALRAAALVLALAPALAARAWAVAPAPARPASPLVCARTLIEKLRTSGRAEAILIQSVPSDSGPARRRGTLALETPSRLRIDYADDGERITMRPDGGEWLQPPMRQMLLMSRGQVVGPLSVWRWLDSGAAPDLKERRLGDDRFEIVPTNGATSFPDTLWVTLGVGGLPSRIQSRTGDLAWEALLSRWRFTRARGAASFKTRAPAGYETLDMP